MLSLASEKVRHPLSQSSWTLTLRGLLLSLSGVLWPGEAQYSPEERDTVHRPRPGSVLDQSFLWTVSLAKPRAQWLLSPTSTSQLCLPELKTSEPRMLCGLTNLSGLSGRGCSSHTDTLERSGDTLKHTEPVLGSMVTGTEEHNVSVKQRKRHISILKVNTLHTLNVQKHSPLCHCNYMHCAAKLQKSNNFTMFTIVFISITYSPWVPIDMYKITTHSAIVWQLVLSAHNQLYDIWSIVLVHAGHGVMCSAVSYWSWVLVSHSPITAHPLNEGGHLNMTSSSLIPTQLHCHSCSAAKNLPPPPQPPPFSTESKHGCGKWYSSWTNVSCLLPQLGGLACVPCFILSCGSANPMNIRMTPSEPAKLFSHFW